MKKTNRNLYRDAAARSGRVAVVFNVGLLILACGWVLFMVGLALTQSPDCPGVVSPYGRIANVRPQPNLTVSPVATLSAGNSLASGEAIRGWYPLCEGNYISESVARYMTNTPQSALRTTPTRIAAQLIYCANRPRVVEIEPGLWRVVCEYR